MMWESLFLLLPVAASSGWYLGQKKQVQKHKQQKHLLPSKYFSGVSYLLNEQPDKAVDVFLQMLDLNDELIETHLMVGNLYRRRGEVDRAIRVHQALMARPNLSNKYRRLAQLELAKDYVRAGVLDRGESLLLDLCEAGVELEVSLKYLLEIYQQSKEWERAIPVAHRLQKATGKKQNNKIAHYHCEMAQVAWLEGNLEDAEKNVKLALKVDPHCVRASLLQGHLAASQNEFKEAIKAYQRVHQQDPRFLSEVVSAMGRCYERLNQSEKMFKYLKDRLHDEPAIGAILHFSDWLYATEGSHSALKFITEHLRKYPSIQGLSRVVQLNLSCSSGKVRNDLQVLQELIDKILIKRPTYRCKNCGLSGRMLQWMCPGCQEWDSTCPILGIESD